MKKHQINFRISEDCQNYIETYQQNHHLKNKTDALEQMILTVKRMETSEESELKLLKNLEKKLHELSFAIKNADKNSDIALLMLNHLASVHDLKNLTEKQMNHIVRAREMVNERIANAKQKKDFLFGGDTT